MTPSAGAAGHSGAGRSGVDRRSGSAALALAAKLVLAPLLIAQALQVRRRALILPEAGGPRSGRVEPPRAGSAALRCDPGQRPAAAAGHRGAAVAAAADPVACHVADRGAPLKLLIVGDSSAAGVGVSTQDQALAGQLGRALAATLQRPVEWQLHARTGLATRDALTMLQAMPPGSVGAADIAVVVLGVNDVISRVPVRRALADRAALADWLLHALPVGHVLFAPLPPMGRFPLLPQPLRALIGADARRHDAALAAWAGGRDDVTHWPIPLDLTPALMAVDGFHPGESLYRLCAQALADGIAAHGLAPRGDNRWR